MPTQPDTGIFADRVAVITGAGQGAGRGCALALAAKGVRVALSGRTEAKLTAVAEEIGVPDRTLIVPGDVTDAAVRQGIVDKTVARFGRLDILVNAAQSPSMRDGPVADTSAALVSELWQSGFVATLEMMKLVRPQMMANRVGSIINFGSGVQAQPERYGIYASVKSAVGTMSRAAAVEWAADGIRVNCVMPMVHSPSFEEFRATYPERAEMVENGKPLGRVGDPILDIGRAVVFLAGPDSSFVTGHWLPLDGGATFFR